MFTVDEKTTLVGLTDLRTKTKKMLELLRDSRIVLTDRNTPCAVVIAYESYQKMREFIEMAEEELDCKEISARKRKNKGKFLSHENIVQKLAAKHK